MVSATIVGAILAAVIFALVLEIAAQAGRLGAEA